MPPVLDVYDVTNTNHLGELTEPYGVSWFDDVRIPGLLRFAVDVASETDLALLQARRVVRVRTGANPGEGDLPPGGIVQDRPASLVADVQPEAGKTISVVTFPCPGLLAWLGYAQGGGVLETARAFDGEDLTVVRGRQLNPRLWGWPSHDFDDSPWITPFAHGTQANPDVDTLFGHPEGWPTGQAATLPQWIWGTALDGNQRHDPGVTYLRGVWETTFEGPVLIFWSADNEGELHVDGGEAGQTRQTNRYAWRDTIRQELTVLGEDVLFAAKVTNDPPTQGANPGGLVLVVTSVTADGEPGEVLFWSNTDDWVALPYPETVPGVTVGHVAIPAFAEAHLRGELAQVTLDPTITALVDSGADPWEREFTYAFRVQELGSLVDELADFRCEPAMGLDNILRLYNQRGSDRTATVTIETPFALDLTGRGPQATRYFYETRNGFGRAVVEAAETALGVVMAKVAQFGTSVGPDEHGQPVTDQLQADSSPLYDEVEVDLPDTVAPYGIGTGDPVFPGDLVMCQARNGTAPVRLMSLRGVLLRGGDIDWSASAVPHDE